LTGKRKDAQYCNKTCKNLHDNSLYPIQRKVKKLQGRGLLFDIAPYLQPKTLPFKKGL
jgi:hypothetical protein